MNNAPFESMAIVVLTATLVILSGEMMFWVLLKILRRLGVKKRAGPMERSPGLLLLLTFFICLFAGAILIITYGSAVTMFKGDSSIQRIH